MCNFRFPQSGNANVFIILTDIKNFSHLEKEKKVSPAFLQNIGFRFLPVILQTSEDYDDFA